MPRRHFVILALYCLLTLVLTSPLSCDMGEALAGASSDVYINPWADWWTKKALSEGLDFYHTDYMFYPQGTSLVFHSFSHANTALSLILAPLVGRLVAYNLTILLAYALSGFGMYLLAHDLTGCTPAAVVAGVVFAFCPYHMFESAHPVLVTTQWIPLFVLALRMFRDVDARWFRQSLLAALWFTLNALSSWHLMIMLSGWIVLYLSYVLVFERGAWTADVGRFLLTFVVVAGVAIAPFLWPIVQEQLVEDTSYMAVDVEEGLGNDLLSFFVPNRRHPVFSAPFAGVYPKIGFVEKRPAYLGYVVLILAIVGAVTARRATRFWLWTGGLFFVLSLGARVTLGGEPLHDFVLPWAIPIIRLLRHPFRLNILLFFSLSILSCFGMRWLTHKVASKRPVLVYPVLALVLGLVVLEYLVHPFPTTPLIHSPFFRQLAQEDRDFAIADLPMGRRAAKSYLFFQTIHGKKIVDGVVSRTPEDAYAFVQAHSLLRSLSVPTALDPALDVSHQLAVLAAQDIRYVILHKHLLHPDERVLWEEWLADFPAPYYEDQWIVAYRTIPSRKTELLDDKSFQRLAVRLGHQVHLQSYRLSAGELAAWETLTLTLLWQSDARLAEDYHVFVHLLDAQGNLVAQSDGVPVQGARPTWSWWEGEVIQDAYTLSIPADLAAGTYTISVGMYDWQTGVRLPAFDATGNRLPNDSVPLGQVRVSAGNP